MNKNKFNSLWYIVPTITAIAVTFIISRYFKMNFWETFFCTLLAGLFLLFITWIIKNINRKKLYIIIVTKKLIKGKYKTTILLWNHSWIKDVYNNDYGERGLELVTDYDRIIDRLNKPNGIRFARNFNFSVIPNTAKNTLNLQMDTLRTKAFVEFDFEINNSETADSKSMIILPNIITDKSFEKIPGISFRYDRTNLIIRELKYKKSLQIYHWTCRLLAVFTVLITAILSLLFGYSIEIIYCGATLVTILVTTSVSLGGFVPRFVVKHMKNNGYIETNNSYL